MVLLYVFGLCVRRGAEARAWYLVVTDGGGMQNVVPIVTLVHKCAGQNGESKLIQAQNIYVNVNVMHV